MKVSLKQDVLKAFPNASIHGVIISGLEKLDSSIANEWRLRALQEVANRHIPADRITSENEIVEWRDAYRKIGIKPTEYRSSIEQLLRRAVKGALPQTPISFVDLYCAISVIARAPIGAYDIAKLQGDIAVRFSEVGELFHGIGSNPERPVASTVVYADRAGIICWAWNFRDSLRTCLETGSRQALMFVDSSESASRSRAQRAIHLLSDALTESGCSLSAPFVLDGTNLNVEISGPM
jgi:DNA/RNA-binding domain of Phe-tRNA-synthetase-like protein